MRRSTKTILIFIAYLISAWFIVNPAPLQIALFVFIAQPLIALAVLLYITEVVRELKNKGVL